MCFLRVEVYYPSSGHAASVLFTCCSTLPIQLLCCFGVVFLLQNPTHSVAMLCQCGLPVAVPYPFSCHVVSVCLPVAVPYPFSCHGVSVLFTCCRILPIQLPCCISVVYLLQYPTHLVAMLCQCCLPVAVPYLSSCCSVSVLFSCCSSTLPIQLPLCFNVVFLLQYPTHPVAMLCVLFTCCSALPIQAPCCVSVPVAVPYPFSCHGVLMLFSCCSTLPIQ